MDINIHDIPTPRPISIALFILTIGFNWIHRLTHDEINAWIASAAGLFSISHYIVTFYKVWKKSKAKRIINNKK